MAALVEKFLGLLMPTAKAYSSQRIKRIKFRGELYFFIRPVKLFRKFSKHWPTQARGKDYEKAVKALNDYFIPKVNSTYHNPLFRSMEQQDGETVAKFVT